MSAQKTAWTKEHVREAAQAMLAAREFCGSQNAALREYIAENKLANDLVSINEARILAHDTWQRWTEEVHAEKAYWQEVHEEAEANLDTPSSPGPTP